MFKLLFLIFLIYCHEAKSFEKKKYEEIINSINLNNFNSFLINIKRNCNNKTFIKKISEHSSYPKFGTIDAWKKTCKKLKKPLQQRAEQFIKNNFILISDSKSSGKLTGYYEPSIKISRFKKGDFVYPILKFKEKYKKSRSEILESYEENHVIFWSNSDIDIFFLQIQGSGIGVLPDGKKVKLSYAGNNGYEYTSIGKVLVKKKKINKEEVSLFSIKKWLRENRTQVNEIFNLNKRYIFFKEEKYTLKSAKGAFGVNLVANLSIAIDKQIYPYGLPFYLLTDNSAFNLFTISHDTGSAIKGKNRADLFLGKGKEAEIIAGNLSKKLQLYVLMPYN